MYESRWIGFWEQQGFGRQPMHPLVLRFDDGEIQGEGADIIGPFTFAGRYQQDGSVFLVKQYLGQHQVLYRGTYDGEGMIWGQWSIHDSLRGPFQMKLDRTPTQQDLRIRALAAHPEV